MPAPVPRPEGTVADACAELRRVAASRCDEARAAAHVHAAAAERTHVLRRDLVAAEHAVATAQAAADPRPRSAEKSRAREVYLAARDEAADEAAQSAAVATWAHAVDRINHATRLAVRALAKARAEAARLERALHEAERVEQAARIRAEAAEASCLDARVRLAACEERLLAASQPGDPDVAPSPAGQPRAVAGSSVGTIGKSPHGEPLVIESMVSGDRRALELAATAIAEHVQLSPAAIRVQLQELVDAIASVAGQEGFLLFDPAHQFWSNLTADEARDVLAALTRLGFRFEPAEGWHAGRAPTPSDLSLALAYAGLDARNVRGLPSAAELRTLPSSIGIDARAFLAAFAPDLAMDQLVRLLEVRAVKLAPLWDAWGLVRPVLLSPRRSLGTLPG
jgi:hypothetical protein